MRSRLIGMRTIKTALVVIVAYFVSTKVPNSLPFAMIYAGVICVETSVVSSFSIGYNRVIGTILGGVIGLLVSYIPVYRGVIMAFGIVITILVCNYLDIKKTTGIAITLVIIIALGPEEYIPAVYAMQRTLDTILGIIIATIINTVVYPPNQMKMVRDSFTSYKKISRKILRDVILYKLEDGVTAMGDALEDFRHKFNDLNTEIAILKKYDQEEYDYYSQMIEEAEKVYIHTEALSIIEQGVKMTMDNNMKLTKILAMDTMQTEFTTMEKSTREDLIFNYTLAKLISSMEKIHREKTFHSSL